jgi:hypothetical protein
MTQRGIVWSWGARGWTNIQNKALAFRVSGLKFKGYVVITLNFLDLYDVDFMNIRGEVKCSKKDVYCDVLVQVIDNVVEKTENYKEDVKKAYSL